jgi:VCBS repeat-containing protein
LAPDPPMTMLPVGKSVAAAGLLTNDTDPDGDSVTAQAGNTTSAAGALVTVYSDGSYTYDPRGVISFQQLTTGGVDTDTFTYSIGDGNGGSDSATVTVTVYGINDDPTISGIGSQTIDEDNTLGLLNFTIGDVESTPSLLTVSIDPASYSTLFPTGSIVIGGSGANQTVTVTPAANAYGMGTVILNVSDPDGGTASMSFVITVNSVNDAPTITSPGNKSNIEGDPPVNFTVAANDVDHALPTLTFAAANFPPGITISPGSGVISGRVNYTGGTTTYNCSVTVTDPDGSSATTNFDWSITNSAIASLSGTEQHYEAGVEFDPGSWITLPNSISVTGITTNRIYVDPANDVKLQYFGAGAMPNASDVRFRVTNGGGTPSSGSFTTHNPPRISPNGSAAFTIGVGIDADLSDSLEDAEVTHSFDVRIVNFSDDTIYSHRTAGGPAEALFPILANEIYEIGGTFEFKLAKSSGAGNTIDENAGLVRFEFWDTDGIDDLLQNGTGTDFSRPLASGDATDAFVRFYYDGNNNSQYDVGEQKKDSPDFRVVAINALSFTFDISNDILAFRPMTVAQRLAAVQQAVDTGVNLLRTKNSATDYRAAVTIVMSAAAGPTEIFTPNASRPDPISATDVNADGRADDAQTHFNDMPSSRIRFVNNFVNQRGEADDIPGSKAIVDWNAMRADTIVHEIGHTLGLSHTGTTMNVMREGLTRAVGSNELEQSQADKYSGL